MFLTGRVGDFVLPQSCCYLQDKFLLKKREFTASVHILVLGKHFLNRIGQTGTKWIYRRANFVGAS